MDESVFDGINIHAEFLCAQTGKSFSINEGLKRMEVGH